MSLRFIVVSKFLMQMVVPFVFFPAILALQIYFSYEVALFPLYLVPVVQLSVAYGWRGAVVSVVLAIGLWLLGSYAVGQPYSSEALRYYNAGSRGVIFMLAAVFVLFTRRSMRNHRRQMEAIKALLNVCHGCGSIQGGDGQWVRMDELENRAKPAQCECPRCAAVVRERVN